METCFLFSALSVKRYRASGFSLNGRDGRRKGGEGRGKRESGGKEGGRGGRERRGRKGRKGWMVAYRSRKEFVCSNLYCFTTDNRSVCRGLSG